MLKTEDEAKERWCHKTFRPDPAVAESLYQRQIKNSRCITSQCMAWQWISTYTPKSADSPNAGKVHRSDMGYCGLAGKP